MFVEASEHGFQDFNRTQERGHPRTNQDTKWVGPQTESECLWDQKRKQWDSELLQDVMDDGAKGQNADNEEIERKQTVRKRNK